MDKGDQKRRFPRRTDSDDPPPSLQTSVDPESESYSGLPDASVPLGLLAKLAISNSKDRSKAVAADIARAENPDDDDDNVVSLGRVRIPT